MAADSAIILVGDDPAALQVAIAPVRKRLSRRGWSCKANALFLAVFAPSGGRLDVTGALDGHGVLVGEIFDGAGAALAPEARRVLGCRPLDEVRARAVSSDYWGRYLLIRRSAGEVAILRDPSGAVDCVVWRRGAVTFVATGADDVIDLQLV